MASKKYGNWELVQPNPELGLGGQGYVYRVTDTTGTHPGEYALKWVKNPKRAERFRAEIEAVKRLDHPNIIKPIDHSALDSGEADRQYLVMPIAAGKDLSDLDRLSTFRGMIDPVLAVALQIAEALKAAHVAGITHRDVKPPNILFSGVGNHIWLSDFGICLIRDQPRNSEVGEVVGPWSYMAPELEAGGGTLEVTHAADIYSLGKVIYFMISGGKMFPRERLGEEQYAAVLRQGERFLMLRSLLDVMICQLPTRLKDMNSVITRLKKIADWELTAKQPAITTSGLAALARIGDRQKKANSTIEANAEARRQEKDALAAVETSFNSWMKAELGAAAEQFAETVSMPCRANQVSIDNEQAWPVEGMGQRRFVPLSVYELQLDETVGPFPHRHHLQFRLAQLREPKVTVHVGNSPRPAAKEPFEDFQLAIIPYYRQAIIGQKGMSAFGFLTIPGLVNTMTGNVRITTFPQRGPRVTQHRVGSLAQSFHPKQCQHLGFKMSEWPLSEEARSAFIGAAVDSFITLVEGNSRS